MSRPYEADRRYCASQVACDGVPIPRHLPRDICGKCEKKLALRKKTIPLRGENTRG